MSPSFTVSVFLNTVLDTVIDEVHRATLCGNLAPMIYGEGPSLNKFTACRAVPWGDSQTIDETRLPAESDTEYENRMKDSANAALGELQNGDYQAAIMSIDLFLNSRGG